MHDVVVIDASVWISRLTRGDVNHTSSLTWMQPYTDNDGILAAPDLLLLEVAASISRRTGRVEAARQALEYVTANMAQLASVDTLLAGAIEVSITLRLRAGDALYVALAHQLGIPLISWDKEQLARAAPLVETYSPDMYPF